LLDGNEQSRPRSTTIDLKKRVQML
jgi:hypothetical protein